jgi:two-component system OmpR family sensor kinase
MQSLRVKLALITGGAACLVVLACFALFWGLHATDRVIERALAAQTRLDLLAELSGRLTRYGLAAVDAAGGSGAQAEGLAPAGAAARHALDMAADRLRSSVGATGDELGRTELASRSRLFAQMYASLALLDRQFDLVLRDADRGRRVDEVGGALNTFSAVTGPSLSFLVDADRRAVEVTSSEARSLSGRLRIAAVGAALVALIALAVLYRLVTRPLLVRIAAIRAASGEIGRGVPDARLPIRARDELGLLVASFNRMAARLSRRERAVAADRAALEGTIAARTADLHAANERLAAIDQSRRRFFADVSHEFRTPLTVILGECDLTAQHPPSTPDGVRAAMSTVRVQAQRLHRRIADLLRIARSESGEIELDMQPLGAFAVLTDAVAAAAIAARRRHIALELKPATRDIEILADPEWLRQVVEGLIDNALRHAEGATRITVGLEDTRFGAAITVADDGPGFPAGEAELLQRFRRSSSRTEGFGIGLALAAWIVERHGGTMHLGADRAGGARVTLDWPACARENAA